MTDQRTDYTPILCGDYEVLELVCMDRNTIELDVGGRKLIGVASDLAIRSAEEFLVLENGQGDVEMIRVDRIRRLKVLSEPRRFDEHVFAVADDIKISDPS